jgi:phosphoribosylformylglycinamidine (FGAM) synthase PurS component
MIRLKGIRTEIFTNPVTQVSSLQPLDVDFDWIIWVGFRPGVRDNPGATALEALEDLLGLQLKPGEAVYTSKRYCLKGNGITRRDAEKIAGELLANDIIQQWAVFDPGQMGSGHRDRVYDSQGHSGPPARGGHAGYRQ